MTESLDLSPSASGKKKTTQKSQDSAKKNSSTDTANKKRVVKTLINHFEKN
jgi:hypothetical protein